MVARTARLLLDLGEGLPLASKHAVDYLRLMELVDPSHAEAAWQDHRRPTHPMSFLETNAVLHRLIRSRSDLLIAPEYSKDIAQVCTRCVPTPPFQLADGSTVFSLLGYY